jgi:hypothetical protein
VLIGVGLLCALPWLVEYAQAPTDVAAFAEQVGCTGADCGKCLAAHCKLATAKCMLDSSCRKTAICNTKCQGKPNDLACDLLCELTSGYNSTVYRSMLKCMNDNHCLPLSPGSDGICLSPTPSEAGKVLTSMDQMAGKWYIFKGMNCGQNKQWPAGFDAFPCQRDEFVKSPGTVTGWTDHIAYCGGNVSESQDCKTKIVNTEADVYISTPGVMTHNYTDAPLLPQNEEWRVLSWPDQGDWMLYIYCGYTPTGAYAGGSVVSRSSARRMSEIPPAYDAEFRKVSKQYGFDYDSMCVSDLSACED